MRNSVCTVVYGYTCFSLLYFAAIIVPIIISVYKVLSL